MASDDCDGAPRCGRHGCNADPLPCYLDDDLLADPRRVTEWFCPEHAAEAGYCWGCGRFFAGIEDFDFGNGLCEDCRVELAEDEEEWDEDAEWEEEFFGEEA